MGGQPGELGPDGSWGQIAAEGGPDGSIGQMRCKRGPSATPSPFGYTIHYLESHPFYLVPHLYLIPIPLTGTTFPIWYVIPYLVPHSSTWYPIPVTGTSSSLSGTPSSLSSTPSPFWYPSLSGSPFPYRVFHHPIYYPILDKGHPYNNGSPKWKSPLLDIYYNRSDVR